MSRSIAARPSSVSICVSMRCAMSLKASARSPISSSRRISTRVPAAPAASACVPWVNWRSGCSVRRMLQWLNKATASSPSQRHRAEPQCQRQTLPSNPWPRRLLGEEPLAGTELAGQEQLRARADHVAARLGQIALALQRRILADVAHEQAAAVVAHAPGGVQAGVGQRRPQVAAVRPRRSSAASRRGRRRAAPAAGWAARSPARRLHVGGACAAACGRSRPLSARRPDTGAGWRCSLAGQWVSTLRPPSSVTWWNTWPRPAGSVSVAIRGPLGSASGASRSSDLALSSRSSTWRLTWRVACAARAEAQVFGDLAWSRGVAIQSVSASGSTATSTNSRNRRCASRLREVRARVAHCRAVGLRSRPRRRRSARCWRG